MFSTTHWATPVPRRWGILLTLLWPLQRYGFPGAGRLYHKAWWWAGARPTDPCDCAGCSA
jgi:hypothetical protein